MTGARILRPLAVVGVLVLPQGCGEGRDEGVPRAMAERTGLRDVACEATGGTAGPPSCQRLSASWHGDLPVTAREARIEGGSGRVGMVGVRAGDRTAAAVEVHDGTGGFDLSGFAGPVAGMEARAARVSYRPEEAAAGRARGARIRFEGLEIRGLAGLSGQASLGWRADGALDLQVTDLRGGGATIGFAAILEGAPADIGEALGADAGRWAATRVRSARFEGEVREGSLADWLRRTLDDAAGGDVASRTGLEMIRGGLARGRLTVSGHVMTEAGIDPKLAMAGLAGSDVPGLHVLRLAIDGVDALADRPGPGDGARGPEGRVSP